MDSILAGKTAAKKIATTLAIILSVVHVLNIWLMFPSHMMRGMHLAFILILIYLGKSFDGKNRLKAFLNIVELLIGAYCCAYYAFHYEDLAYRMNSLTMTDKVVGLLMILILVDAT